LITRSPVITGYAVMLSGAVIVIFPRNDPIVISLDCNATQFQIKILAHKNSPLRESFDLCDELR